MTLEIVKPVCGWCAEPIEDDGAGDGLTDSTCSGDKAPGVNGNLHRECLMRMVLGSVAHIQKRCHCYVPGSEENDDPSLTLRQAAKAVAALVAK